MGSLSGKTVLISGVARGQGRAHALAVAREGGNVIGLDVCDQIAGIRYPLASKEDLAKTVQRVEDLDGRIVARAADVRSQVAIDAVVAEGVAEFGGLHGVVANAGLWDPAPMIEASEESWATVMDVNVSGVWRLVKSAAPHLTAARAGSIVIISSINGKEPAAGYCSYVVAKHAVIGLMRNAALELAPMNVRCNAICPGAVDTAILSNEMGYQQFVPPGEEPCREALIGAMYGFGALPGRSGMPPSAISNGVVFLLSDAAEHITGTELVIDAGHLIQPGWNMAPQTEGPEADRYRPLADPDDY